MGQFHEIVKSKQSTAPVALATEMTRPLAPWSSGAKKIKEISPKMSRDYFLIFVTNCCVAAIS